MQRTQAIEQHLRLYPEYNAAHRRRRCLETELRQLRLMRKAVEAGGDVADLDYAIRTSREELRQILLEIQEIQRSFGAIPSEDL